MDVYYRIIIGRGCRWLLLVGVIGVCLFVGWTATLATGNVAVESQTKLIMPDGMYYPPGKRRFLRGLVIPAPKYTSSIAIWSHKGSESLGTLTNQWIGPRKSSCYLSIGKILERGSTLRIIGMPYSSLAFTKIECTTKVVPSSKLVIIVKASLALDALANDNPSEINAIAKLAKIGALGFFTDGRADTYPWVRKQLTNHYPSVPVMLIQRGNAWWRRTTRSLCSDLNRRGNRKKSIVIITDKPGMARIFALEGFTAMLIKKEHKILDSPLPESVTIKKTLADIVDSAIIQAHADHFNKTR